MPLKDRRKDIGARVSARARLITSEAECKRRFGSNWATKEVFGTVREVITTQKAKRTATFISAEWELGAGHVKISNVNLRSVYLAGRDKETGVNEGTTVDVTVATEMSSLTETIAARTDWAFGTPPNTTKTDPVATVHGVDWYFDKEQSLTSINGHIPYKAWSLKDMIGDRIGENTDPTKLRSRLDYFLLMFPPKQLTLMVELLNDRLSRRDWPLTSAGELLRFFGVCILITRFEAKGGRRTLWRRQQTSKYVPAPCLGDTGMSRRRFDQLWGCLRFGKQPDERPAGMSHESYRWLLVDDFVANFNEYRRSTFDPSDLLCADESISRWYGLGGIWINMGLPMYISMDRKPENGCEIQDVACARSGVMLNLKIVKSADNRNESEAQPDNGVGNEDELPHGGKVLLELIKPWYHTPRIVVADSYFASVATAQALLEVGIRFIGVIKQATKKFPLAYFKEQEMAVRGDRTGLVRRDDKGRPFMHACCFLDRDRQTFISTTSSLQPGGLQERYRWRQVDNTPNAEPEKVDVSIHVPLVPEIYYSAAATIDQHNRARQDDLDLEKKLRTQDWHKRVGLTILGIIIVDTWNVYSKATRELSRISGTQEMEALEEAKNDFFESLADELIDNTLDSTHVTSRRSVASPNSAVAASASSVGCTSTSCHGGPLAPTTGEGVRLVCATRPKRRRDGTIIKNQSARGRCRVCGATSTQVCSACIELGTEEARAHFCKPGKKAKTCFAQHIRDTHPPLDLDSLF